MKRKQAPPAPPVPFNGARDTETLQDMGLVTMAYRDACTMPDADGRRWWIPANLASPDLA